MKICVFCASSESVDNVYFKAAADLGKEIDTGMGVAVWRNKLRVDA